jgi:serine/threonine-protein kinase
MQCCSALTAAHGWVEQDGRARPIVHRDVSPGNILLSVDGHALLADLAAPDDDEAGGESVAPRFFGNLAYAAPEALRQQAIDARADLYSLGCVLYEALAGAPAFEGDDERAVMFQILERGAPELSTRAPDVPPDLARVVQRCLERRREDRFASARELHAALSACQAGRTAFSLERETAALIREVLGARIREREEMMHGAYERFAPSALARTDTLPIAGAETPPPLVRPVAAISQPVASGVAPSGRRRWPLLLALFALVAVVGVLARESSRPSESVTTRANQPAPETAAGNAPGSAGNSGDAPEANGGAKEAVASEPSTATRPARDAGAHDQTTAIERREQSADASGEAKPARPAASAGVASSASKPPSAPGTRTQAAPKPRARARIATPEPPPSDPFRGVRLEGSPYEEHVRQLKAKASQPAAPAPDPTLPEPAPANPAPAVPPPAQN